MPRSSPLPRPKVSAGGRRPTNEPPTSLVCCLITSLRPHRRPEVRSLLTEQAQQKGKVIYLRGEQRMLKRFSIEADTTVRVLEHGAEASGAGSAFAILEELKQLTG